MDLGLSGRCFIVTGGSRGLGRAVAAELVAEGSRVLVAARSGSQQAAAALGSGAVGLDCDLTDEDAPRRLIETARAELGRLDGAFVSHGGPPASSALDLDDETLRSAVEGSLVAPIRFVRALARELGPGGAIAVLTSGSSREPIPGLATSNLTRPGMWGYVKTLSDELAGRQVRVNCVVPGSFATDRILDLLSRRAEESGRSVDELRAESEGGIPLGRIGDPAELGRVAAFLLSPAASYVTGAAWVVDGGSLRGL